MRRVKALAYNGLCTFEFGIMTELFALPRPEFPSWYHFQTVGFEQNIGAMGGLSSQVKGTLENLRMADTIVIPGWQNPTRATSKSPAQSSQMRHPSVLHLH